MRAASPTLSQIKAQVAAIPEKSRRGKAVGIQCSERWTGESPVGVDGQQFVIRQCNSPLEMRLALREPANAGATRVLITSLGDQDLSQDILLRLAKQRLFPLNSWQNVRTLFGAQAIDPRLTAHPWMADALLELIPYEDYPSARGGYLDAETVWPLLLKRSIGLAADAPDLTELLKWSLNPECTDWFRRCAGAFRAAAIAWLAEKAGPAVEIVLRCIEDQKRPDAVPIGLTAGIVYHAAATGKLERATGKLEERYLGGRTPEPDLMQRWSTAATEVVRSLRHTDIRQHRQILQRADEILGEIQADAFAHLSDTSPRGFDQRLARFGERLAEVLERQAWDQLDGLLEASGAVRQHDQASREMRRMQRVEMSLRLVRWMATRRGESEPAFTSLPEAASTHLRDGGFVDWARLSLRAGDPVRELSAAYARLFESVREVRERQSQAFARLLADWTAAGSQSDDVLPVERVLERIVAPLAAKQLVLVIVIDGMSAAVCRELLADLTGHDWTVLSEPGRDFTRPGIAVVPSVTEFSRTSLLCGQLRQGTSADELRGFAEHPALLANCRSGVPPVLFHKASLQETDDTVLAKDVRDAIHSTHRRVVGVVVNAVDDHLLKGEQIDTRWSRDEIKVLPALLHEARVAPRLVVLVSDHGHVLDCQAEARTGDGGERYRTAAGAPAADELLIQGSRVLTEGRKLIAPWTERVRYGVKKNGYHGGLTPQEMVVPVVVLASTDDFPAGWTEQTIDTPEWWDEPTETLTREPQPTPQLKPVKPKPTGKLFELDGEDKSSAGQRPTPVTRQRTAPAWVSRLLASPVFAEQKRFGGRGLPTDEVFGQLLTLVDQHGGKMTSVALARSLQFSAMRLPGLLAKAERVLNVDGYDILRRDDVADTVELNRELLLKQFDLVE